MTQSYFCSVLLRRRKKSSTMQFPSHFKVMNNVVPCQAFLCVVLVGSHLLGRQEVVVLGYQHAPSSVKTCKHLLSMCVGERTWRQQSEVQSYDTIRRWQWANSWGLGNWGFNYEVEKISSFLLAIGLYWMAQIYLYSEKLMPYWW